jgi:agmatine deiminase
MVIDKNFNPLENGYTFPAEWEEHEATWLSWPHKEESWPERIDLIYPAYAQFIAELTKGEFVCINVKDQEMQAFAMEHISKAGAIFPKSNSISTKPMMHGAEITDRHF